MRNEKKGCHLMKVAQNIAELIGDTPLVKLQRLQPENAAAVYLKLESFNPSGSVKDRAAYNMLIEAEKQGKLTKGATIIEPTSGNTGIGLAMNAAARGYKAILVMPDTMTKERINILKAYGAQVVLTPGEEKMPGCIRKAEELAAQIPHSFIPMQFDNRANPDAHRGTTAVEIMEAVKQLDSLLSLCRNSWDWRYYYWNWRGIKEGLSSFDHPCGRAEGISCLIWRETRET